MSFQLIWRTSTFVILYKPSSNRHHNLKTGSWNRNEEAGKKWETAVLDPVGRPGFHLLDRLLSSVLWIKCVISFDISLLRPQRYRSEFGWRLRLQSWDDAYETLKAHAHLFFLSLRRIVTLAAKFTQSLTLLVLVCYACPFFVQNPPSWSTKWRYQGRVAAVPMHRQGPTSVEGGWLAGSDVNTAILSENFRGVTSLAIGWLVICDGEGVCHPGWSFSSVWGGAPYP